MSNSKWAVPVMLALAVTIGLFLIAIAPIGLPARLLAFTAVVTLAGLVYLQCRNAQQAALSLAESQAELETEIATLSKKLHEAEAFGQSVMDGVADPAIIIDRDFKVTSINKAARERFPDNDGSGEPLHCYRALHGRDTPCEGGEHPCVLTSGGACKHLQTEIGHDGTERVVELRATPLYDDVGNLTGAIEVLHQLNEQERLALRLQRAREDAETAVQARSEFVALLSHEVRTPMNAVLGMLDLLRLTSLTRKQESYVHVMESSSSMLLSLVDNMLDFGSLESGTFTLKEEAFWANDLLESALEIMGYQAQSKGLELAGSTNFDTDVQLVGDSDRLQQIIINLVSNAIKFTESGEVIVAIATTGDHDTPRLEVSVRDTGIGMDSAQASTLFQPFAAIGESRVSRGRGSGLGLAISKKLIDLMGGDISCDSTPGEGTTISFSVPVRPVPDASRASEEVSQILHNRRLLVVNDNQSVADSILSFLTSWNATCETEQNSGQVTDRVSAAAAAGRDYDCVILDVERDVRGRLSLAREIRRYSDVPIILLTSIAHPLKVGQISAIGNVRCVNKPVLPGELRRNLSRLLEINALPAEATKDIAFDEMRILIAEDNPLNRKVLRRMLESLGLEADSVNDGPSVLTALADECYDLILMDCQMPGMDGDEVTRILRERPCKGEGQPVIVAITADVSLDHRERCLEAGMDDFLAKPLRLGGLKSGLRRWSVMVDARKERALLARESAARTPVDAEEPQLQRVELADISTYSEYIDLFIDDTTMRIGNLASALDREDLETVRRECHALKGACLELGASRLGICCDALGKASRENRPDDLPDAYRDLVEEFERVRPAIEAEKREAL